ncbi:hypothetical protein T459_04856 [Capsicum annuum]|uniref:Uncharacterized protein n=1 Tax=Capsicum annuum TaxID=4072 RepID=A0A2G3A6D0_CAPAN|nr:hypothetical protein FXO37_24008 [Capsicum annuum]PHT89743.1 hypothetical protein T459_04856 [Capsicum annuum]
MTISDRSMNRSVDDLRVKPDPSNKPPVYLSNAQRKQLALQDEIAEKKRRHEHRPYPDNRHDHSRWNRKRDRESRGRESQLEALGLEKELEAIREQYLGSKKSKKRVIEREQKKLAANKERELQEEILNKEGVVANAVEIAALMKK